MDTALTQHTWPTVNDNHETFRLSRSGHCRKDFRFLGNQESYLHVVVDRNLSRPEKKAVECTAYLYVRSGKFISVQIKPFEMTHACEDGLFQIEINRRYFCVRLCTDDRIAAHRETARSERTFENVVTVHGSKNKLKCRFIFGKETAFGLTIRIAALDRDRKKWLVVSHQTNVSGTVNPYGFDAFTDYALDMHAYAYLTPPHGHNVIISFPHFDILASDWCYVDRLKFKLNWATIWKRCGHFQSPPEMYRGKLRFTFFSYPHSRGHSGFKMLFSFHGPHKVPAKLLTTSLNTAVFNCSVPFFSNFKQHLQCNLDTECDNAQDEASCPYSRGTCKSGFLSAGSKCYKYIKLGYKRMTWYDASAVCLKQGLRLASFLTPKEEGAFRDDILQFAFTTSHFFFGMRTSDPSLPVMYREVWQWSNGIMAYYVDIEQKLLFKPTCAALNRMSKDKISVKVCGAYLFMDFIFCETETPVFNNSGKINLKPVEIGSTFGVKRSKRFVSCSSHETHDFLSCDHMSRCGTELGVTSCVTHRSVKSDKKENRVEVSMFVCDSQTQTIHYTQTCDHITQCFDSSDETFCIYHTCPEQKCNNLQCVMAVQWCDGMAHCSDGSDEDCPQFVTESGKQLSSSNSKFHIVFFDGHGRYTYVSQSTEFPDCSPTHFLCANYALCLPAYLRCNGVYDCSTREDEYSCDDVTCLGYYRCLRSAVCVHSHHVCDGIFQCPEQDDELLCELVCPDSCLCQGLAFVCTQPFQVQSQSNLRYLDASESGLTPGLLFHNHYLIRLVLSSCELQTLPVLKFPNLKFLDLSNNLLTNIGMYVFLNLTNLNVLDLSHNPVVNVTAAESNTLLENVHSFDVSYTSLRCFESDKFWNIRNLKTLNFSHSMLNSISSSGFESLTQIESLDLRGTDLKEYPVQMLRSLQSLHVIFTDVYKLCCQDVLPEHFSIQNCHTSPDEIASCKDLLRSEIYRMFLWIYCCFALIGNAASFVTKIYMHWRKPPNTFNVFISNLNVADFFMGMYLVVVGSADQVYRGTYLWHDISWRSSTGCKIAGFFSLLSCEMSAFIICLITLDRFLVISFPFSQLHFGKKSVGVICSVSWMVGVALATMPLLPVTLDWKFYSQTGICIPLPVTRKKFKGHFYSFGILIVLNFFLFVIIAAGQLAIYKSVRGNTIATDKKSEREATVARRLLTVVMSDFLCWFPIGLLGLLASNDVPIPGEVNVAMAIFALPVNSALNPFLYTFNLVMEKRRKVSEQRLLKMLQSRLES